MNILINPTGHPGKFRAVDWAVELLNLFTKVCKAQKAIIANVHSHQVTYSGKFSNKSVEHILNESPLVEIYRHIHDVFGESFCITKKTTSNHGPDMAKTYTALLNAIQREDTHIKVTGRNSDLDAGCLTNKGILSIVATSKSTTAEGITEESNDTQPGEAEGEVEFDREDLMLDDD
jgi:hypothetical protein